MTTIEITAERAVAGGRMLARHQGRVVLVSGAIPGERVRARVERTVRHVIFAAVDEVIEPSPFRRPLASDPACGGLVYAHIDPVHQRSLKGAIVADAFHRIAGIAIAPPPVAGAAEDGYRLRARLHVRDGRAGFFLEGSHTVCDAGPTKQLRSDTFAAIEALVGRMGSEVALCDAIVVSENVEATERVAHLDLRAGARVNQIDRRRVAGDGLIGVSAQAGAKRAVLAGQTRVSDTAATLFEGSPPIDPAARWTRSGASFFQGNRFLTGHLVAEVVDAAVGDRALDLYAGVGLFSVALAATGRDVTAVEGDPSSFEDLEENAVPWASSLRVQHAPVERAMSYTASGGFGTVVLDPPRTGAAPAVVDAIARVSAPRVVYVSCDPATLARDAKRLVDAGYRIASVSGFDLFPNTAHVETIVRFDRA